MTAQGTILALIETKDKNHFHIPNSMYSSYRIWVETILFSTSTRVAFFLVATRLWRCSKYKKNFVLSHLPKSKESFSLPKSRKRDQKQKVRIRKSQFLELTCREICNQNGNQLESNLIQARNLTFLYWTKQRNTTWKKVKNNKLESNI